ncbi:hypothetical protein ACHRVW_23200 [Flavobacterium collinsii]|jgi:hypothetical protein|uniref:Lipoprotein n=1 Tax=Flavobacterium collinsii TaxID=1114861 RepID=A0A9W4THD4_9FLAO|nr:hypothetical protein [Flavobacterium collinsii]CAA9195573.1 hypothetical protein FLACOL7796_00691 [Flavobacterium collinsii]CAI2766987.1 conserved exported protein of unknown function [Flavobacterium collinsii]
MKLYKLLSFSFLFVTLTSCTFTESIYVNDNGTGKFSLNMDGSSLMAMAGNQIGDQLGADAKKNVDSTFTFKQLLADKSESISKLSPEVQSEIKKLEDLVVNIKTNEEKKEFLMAFSEDFKNVNELHDILQSINTLQKLVGGADASTPFVGGLGDNNSTVNYNYDGKKFTRKAIVDKQKLAAKVQDSTAEMSKMVFASSTYVIKYHFPKRIKKVSNPTALFSEDRKTITIQYPFTDYMENPDKLNFDVEFEK